MKREPLATVKELSEYLGVPVRTIYDWRLHRKAPRATKVGRELRFAWKDVDTWLAELKRGAA